jgi:hypothetical protein
MSTIDKLLASHWRQVAPLFRGLDKMPDLTFRERTTEAVEVDVTPAVIELVVAALKRHRHQQSPTPFVGVMPAQA